MNINTWILTVVHRTRPLSVVVGLAILVIAPRAQAQSAEAPMLAVNAGASGSASVLHDDDRQMPETAPDESRNEVLLHGLGMPPPPPRLRQTTIDRRPRWQRLGLPHDMMYRDGMSVPDGFHVDEHIDLGLVVTGLTAMVVPYAFCAAFGATSDTASDRWLLAPVVGPFLVAGNSSTGIYEPDLLVLAAAGQLIGAVLVAVGLLSTERTLERDARPRSHRALARSSRRDWSVTASVAAAPGLAGLALQGTTP